MKLWRIIIFSSITLFPVIGKAQSDSGKIVINQTQVYDTLSDSGWSKPFDEGPSKLYKGRLLVWNGTIAHGKLWEGVQYVYDKEGTMIRIKLYRDGKYFRDQPIEN